jgi:hypothetical protein
VKIKSQKDFWSGVMFVGIGLAFAWGATEYKFGDSSSPGPGYFPFGLGVLLALLGSLVLFKSLTIETHGGDPIGPFAWRPLCVLLAAVVVFGAALPRLGLAVSLPLLVILAGLAGEEFHWRDALISAAVLTLAAWLIFSKGLNLTLPVWPTVFGG